MLKFTKYGKKGPPGSLGLNSLTNFSANGLTKCSAISGHVNGINMNNSVNSPRELVTVTCSHHVHNRRSEPIYSTTVAADEMDIQKAGTSTTASMGSKDREKETERLLRSTPSSASLTRYQQCGHPRQNEVHLKMSKVAPEELVKMDTGYSRIASMNKKRGRSVHFSESTMDLLQEKTERRKASLKHPHQTISCGHSRSIYDTIGKTKIRVYNDGYFPKVQPLNSIFARQISD